MFKRLTIFIVAAVLVLPIGYIGAQWVWFHFHHRYDRPETGLYHGYVTVLFHSVDEPFYWLHFRAESPLHWYWSQPTNFSYTSLEVEWRDESVDRRATVRLPAFTYQADGQSGPFTREILASWLYGGVANQVPDKQHVDAIFGYFEAAAHGSLPGPRHHPYDLEEPVGARIQHFLLGYGVGSTVYVWLAIWLLLVVFVGRRRLKRLGRQQRAKLGSLTA